MSEREPRSASARWALPALLGALALGAISAAVAGTTPDGAPDEAEQVWVDEATGVEVRLEDGVEVHREVRVLTAGDGE